MKVRYEKLITREMCQANPDWIFVFGDNLKKAGKAKGAGQAEIRVEPNAMGIPTKRFPTNEDAAFFSDRDDEIKAVRDALADIYRSAKGKTIVFPQAGVGTGRARMKQKSPKAWARMCQILNDHFDIQNAGYSASPEP